MINVGGLVETGVMSEETVWDEAWDEEFKKCAVRALFKPTRRLRDAYCQVLRHGGAAGKQEPDGPVRGRGVGIHVRTGERRHGADGRRDRNAERCWGW